VAALQRVFQLAYLIHTWQRVSFGRAGRLRQLGQGYAP
jgi:hypothetical protein